MNHKKRGAHETAHTRTRETRRTRRRGASKRAKHHGHGDVSCYLDAACFAKLFVLHIVRDERHTRQRKMLRSCWYVAARHPVLTTVSAAETTEKTCVLQWIIITFNSARRCPSRSPQGKVEVRRALDSKCAFTTLISGTAAKAV